MQTCIESGGNANRYECAAGVEAALHAFQCPLGLPSQAEQAQKQAGSNRNEQDKELTKSYEVYAMENIEDPDNDKQHGSRQHEKRQPEASRRQPPATRGCDQAAHADAS